MWARAANGAGTETLKTFAERAKTMTQALAIVYMFRENVCELTVVRDASIVVDRKHRNRCQEETDSVDETIWSSVAVCLEIFTSLY